MDIYTDDAVLVIELGRNAVEKNEIRKAFEAIAVYFKMDYKLNKMVWKS